MSENIIKIPDTFKVIFDNFDEGYKYRFICYFTGRAGGGGKSANIPRCCYYWADKKIKNSLCAKL